MTATGFALRQRFDDCDLFVATMNGAGGTIVPMGRGPWRAELAMVRVRGLQLYRTDVPPQIRQGAVARGEMVMASRAPPGAILHLGHEAGPGDLSVIGAGTTIDSRFRQPIVWTGVQFDDEGLSRLAEAWRPRLPRAGQHGNLRIGEAPGGRMIAALEDGIAEALRSPGLLAHPAAAAALEDRVGHAVLRALAEQEDWTALPRATAARRRVAHAAVEILATSPAADWTIAHLAHRLGVAPRTLHGAFAAIYGCSPYAFIRRWRLVMVRRVLLAHGEAMLVKTAALDHGFWHLGHFSADYRAMFGESPQETRRAAMRPHGGAWSPGASVQG